MEMTKEEEQKYRDTHIWCRGNELPVCIKCGENPISLGFWGDANYKKNHTENNKPCSITDKKDYKYPEREDRCHANVMKVVE